MLQGRTVVVTGAAGNLGTAVCARLLRDGARVIGLVRRAADRLPAGTEAVVADLADERAVEAAYDRAGAAWGSVHCAGGWAGGTVAQTPLETFERMLAVNLRSAFLCCRAALRRMQEGRIVNVAAYGPAMLTGIGGAAAYAMSKAGVVALTRAIAEEKGGVRCSCVAPGTLRTAANTAGMPGADPSGWVPVEDVAEAIAYLLSPEAGAANGAVITLPSR